MFRVTVQHPQSLQALHFLSKRFRSMTHSRFIPSRLDGVEYVEDYRSGGFHPVAIGDAFCGRYRVIHKLGYGGSSTIWLARSQHEGKLVTLKVMRADLSSRTVPVDKAPELAVPKFIAAASHSTPAIQIVEDHFTETGPNGTHLCIVSQLAGPSISTMSECPGRVSGSRRLRGSLARKAAKAVAEVVALMHSAGFVHGDITTSNILFRLADRVHKWSDNEVYSYFGEPNTERVATRDRSPPGPCAPVELVAPIDQSRFTDCSLLQEDVLLIDFGQSFNASHPPVGYEPATAFNYQSPEARFESRIDTASDVWALACTIFEMRAGFPLFESFLGSDDHVLKETVQMLGKLPDPWWNSFGTRHLWFDDHGEPKSLELQQQARVLLPAERTSIREKFLSIGVNDEPTETDDGPMMEPYGTKLDETEVELLEDLLEKMLRYQPQDRITMRDVISHPWFSLGT
uniref:non-specific serine/threonine protein kinase n=1 Tax=Moniliophthora roreri TaxID=221103 RepID=A0A0W0G6R6_MONRR